MNRIKFLLKFSVDNIKKNKSLFLPYILSNGFIIAMIYMMMTMGRHPSVVDTEFGSSINRVMNLGTVVIAVFGVIFAIYTNSIIIKRRKREFGLYNILGMNKKYISLLVVVESLIVSFLATIVGFAVGIVFDKLMGLLLVNLLSVDVSIDFYISTYSMFYAMAIFIPIFVLNIIISIGRVYIANPIELMNSNKFAEKEPKSRHIISVLGVILIGAGYYISLSEKAPEYVLQYFLAAILLVIIGTYLSFIGVSITILKLLKRSKRIYYKPMNFISISGMMYRMKRNAAGLASICILSTMVLVMVSNTLTLIQNIDDTVRTLSPYDWNIQFTMEDKGESEEPNEVKDIDFNEVKEIVKNNLGKNGIDYHKEYDAGSFIEKKFDKKREAYLALIGIPESKYNEVIKDNKIDLRGNEALVINKGNNSKVQEVDFFNKEYKVIDTLKADKSTKRLGVLGWTSFVVPDWKVLVISDESFNSLRMEDIQSKSEDDRGRFSFQYILGYDFKDPEKYNDRYDEIMNSVLRETSKPSGDSESFFDSFMISHSNRLNSIEAVKEGSGIVLFLSMFLGSVFIAGAVIIIYYKQVSEGFEDKESFLIMKKVGMSDKYIQKAVLRQVLMTFFMPLVVAGVHLAFSFPMTERIMSIMGFTDTFIQVKFTLITFTVFTLIYSLIYFITSRAYYKIVK